jgi:hypothetical protein
MLTNDLIRLGDIPERDLNIDSTKTSLDIYVFVGKYLIQGCNEKKWLLEVTF